MLLAGRGKHGQTSLAGGYDVSAGAACLGPKADLTQSGEFVSISNTKGTLSGDLTLKRGVLSGTVHCVEPHLGTDCRAGLLRAAFGRVGGRPLSAELKRDPPAAGTPKPRVPGSVAGVYALAPTSACLGSKFTLAGSGSRYTLSSANKQRGTLTYRKRHRRCSAERSRCNHGGSRRFAGTAINLTIDTMLIGAGRHAAVSEHVQATKTRTSDQTVVAFFIAMLVVMLFARLCGAIMPRIRQPRVMGEVLAGIILGPTVFGALLPGIQGKLFA